MRLIAYPEKQLYVITYLGLDKIER